MTMTRQLWMMGAGCLACACVLTALVAAPAADPTDTTAKDPKTPEAVAKLAVADDLARYGRKENVPEALIAAAEILVKVPGNAKLEAKVKDSTGKDVTPPTDKEQDIALVKEAKE